MIIPTSKNTYFNTNYVRPAPPLCPYDMLFHPPDYDPKAKRSDRTDSRITVENIWEQEKNKPVASTAQLMYGRPHWRLFDMTSRNYPRKVDKTLVSSTRIHNVIEWAVTINMGKPTVCDL